MSNREKKLIYLLFGAAFIIVNVYLYTSYNAAKTQKQKLLAKGRADIERMQKDIDNAGKLQEDLDWLRDHEPAEGVHDAVRSNLLVAVRQSALKYRVVPKKGPQPLPERADESGAYRSARVEVLANARDRELFLWLTDLQDPQKSRSITFMSITPQRDDPTRVDCKLEVTQWFTPKAEDDAAATTN